MFSPGYKTYSPDFRQEARAVFYVCPVSAHSKEVKDLYPHGSGKD